MLLAVVLLFFAQEQPLATTIERDILPESLEIDGATERLLGEPSSSVVSAAHTP